MTINEFVEELKKLNIEISNLQLEQLNLFYELLIEYNKVMNLTGITDKSEVYLKHFYDSLTICNVINLNKIDSLCDIGTGAGFPGLVLKILFPKLKICLVDSLNKRINFLNIVINTLNLQNVKAIHSRAEDFSRQNREQYDVVTARAVAQINVLAEYCLPLTRVNGYFIPLKGKMDNEREYLCALNKLGAKLVELYSFCLPYENSTRTILKIEKLKETDKKYPRNPNLIKNKPL